MDFVAVKQALRFSPCTVRYSEVGDLLIDDIARLEGCRFDERKARRVVRFIERYVHHVDGAVAGTSFQLSSWERFIVEQLFGWVRADGTRRYRTAYIEVPRKNGKSTLAAAIALYMLAGDGEQGASVVSVAGNEDQARCVWDTAARMVSTSPELSRAITTYRSTLIYQKLNARYCVVSSKDATKHGRNDSCVIFDEVHVQRDENLWNTMTSGVGARRQPLIFAITTAGDRIESVARSLHEYGERVLNGTSQDTSFFCYLRGAREDAAWHRVETWIQANPGLGLDEWLTDDGALSEVAPDWLRAIDVTQPPRDYVTQVRMSLRRSQMRYGESLQLDHLVDSAIQASDSLYALSRFRWLNLNTWRSERARMLDVSAWDACHREMSDEELMDYPCVAGLDMSMRNDITALVLLWKLGDDRYYVRPYFWCPSVGIVDRSQRDHVPYDLWCNAGWLRSTQGDLINVDEVENAIRELVSRFRVAEIVFDPWNALWIERLNDLSIERVQCPQNLRRLSEPTKELIALVGAKRIYHDGNPVMRWMIDNCVAREDVSGNIRPDRANSTEKIDGVIALIMALSRAHVIRDTTQSANNVGVIVI